MNLSIKKIIGILIVGLFGSLELEASPIEPAKTEQATKEKKTMKSASFFKGLKLGDAETAYVVLFGLASILAFITFIVAISIGIYAFWFWSWLIFLALDFTFALFLYISAIYGSGSGSLSGIGRGVVLVLAFLTIIAINALGGIAFLILGILIGQWLIWLGAIFMLLIVVWNIFNIRNL